MTAVVRGTAGAPGLALGRIVRLEGPGGQPRVDVDRSGSPGERLETAQAQVAAHLEDLAAELRAEGKADEAAIFDAQALLASDRALADQAAQIFADERVPLDEAVTRVAGRIAASLAEVDDAYLQARAADVQAIGRQIAAVLQGISLDVGDSVPAGAIVVAADLTPAELMLLRKRRAAGVVTASGSITSHVAILARALGLPALVGIGECWRDIPDGASALLDATGGTLLVDPTPAESVAFQAQVDVARERDRRLAGLTQVAASTADGERIVLWANIGRPEEAALAMQAGAEGIGLFRTEFLFVDRASAPGEDEQYTAYVQTLEAMGDRPVIVRTLDVGADKPLAYLPPLVEANPFLATRGIRFTRRFPELFETQLRALLRAARHGDLRIMLPMVSTPRDLAWARAVLERVTRDLERDAIPHRADLPFGIMLETPAAAVSLDRLAVDRQLAFCSIGSNDLAQYTLAADRTDPALARDYPYDDPSVFRMVRIAVQSARALELEISLCGELAADPRHAVALVGLGLRKLSMVHAALASVKEALLGVSLADAQRQGEQACTASGQ